MSDHVPDDAPDRVKSIYSVSSSVWKPNKIKHFSPFCLVQDGLFFVLLNQSLNQSSRKTCKCNKFAHLTAFCPVFNGFSHHEKCKYNRLCMQMCDHVSKFAIVMSCGSLLVQLWYSFGTEPHLITRNVRKREGITRMYFIYLQRSTSRFNPDVFPGSNGVSI